jgi:hypothetical protein
MECSICRRSQRDGFRKLQCDGIEERDECPTREIPKLLKENHSFMLFFMEVLPVLFDGFGAIRIEALMTFFKIYNVPQGERRVIWRKSLAVIQAIRETRKP